MRSSVIIATWELWAINRPGVLEVEIACTRSIRTVHRAKEAPRVLWHPAPHFQLASYPVKLRWIAMELCLSRRRPPCFLA